MTFLWIFWCVNASPLLKPNQKNYRNMARPRTAHGGVVLWRVVFFGFQNGKLMIFPCKAIGGNSNMSLFSARNLGKFVWWIFFWLVETAKLENICHQAAVWWVCLVVFLVKNVVDLANFKSRVYQMLHGTGIIYLYIYHRFIANVVKKYSSPMEHMG